MAFNCDKLVPFIALAARLDAAGGGRRRGHGPRPLVCLAAGAAVALALGAAAFSLAWPGAAGPSVARASLARAAVVTAGGESADRVKAGLFAPPARQAFALTVPSAAEPVPPTWRRHAVVPMLRAGQPMIAIVLDDLGLDRRRSLKALSLSGPMTMAFLPYARDLARMTRAARAFGHEVLVHVPMEPADPATDPGPRALRVGLDRDEMLARLRWDLDRLDGYVGVNNHMGSRFTSDPEAMAVVMAELGHRGLLFLDSRTSPDTVGPRIARRYDVPVVERDVFRDHDEGTAVVEAQLAELERIAARRGYAVGIGHPRDDTIEALVRWQYEARRRGFALVPISTIARVRAVTTVAEGGANP